MPALRDVVVGWVDCGHEAGVLFIDIPTQPRSSQLFAVPAPNGTEQVSKLAAAVPVRRGDGTTWLPPREIQHYVALGWANAGEVV